MTAPWMTSARLVVHVTALAWLLAVEPLDLAITLGRVATRPIPVPWLLVGLMLLRVAVVALGLATGLSLARRAAASTALAATWAGAEWTTLLVVWTTDVWPTNRPPGLLLPVVGLYALGGLSVLAAARWATQAANAPGRDDLPSLLRPR